HTELADDRGFLRQVTDARARAATHAQAGDLLLVDQDIAAISLDQADDHVEAGGLAGTSGAKQPGDLTAVERPRDSAHSPARCRRKVLPACSRNAWSISTTRSTSAWYSMVSARASTGLLPASGVWR